MIVLNNRSAIIHLTVHKLLEVPLLLFQELLDVLIDFSRVALLVLQELVPVVLILLQKQGKVSVFSLQAPQILVYSPREKSIGVFGATYVFYDFGAYIFNGGTNNLQGFIQLHLDYLVIFPLLLCHFDHFLRHPVTLLHGLVDEILHLVQHGLRGTRVRFLRLLFHLRSLNNLEINCLNY